MTALLQPTNPNLLCPGEYSVILQSRPIRTLIEPYETWDAGCVLKLSIHRDVPDPEIGEIEMNVCY